MGRNSQYGSTASWLPKEKKKSESTYSSKQSSRSSLSSTSMDCCATSFGGVSSSYTIKRRRKKMSDSGGFPWWGWVIILGIVSGWFGSDSDTETKTEPVKQEVEVASVEGYDEAKEEWRKRQIRRAEKEEIEIEAEVMKKEAEAITKRVEKDFSEDDLTKKYGW